MNNRNKAKAATTFVGMVTLWLTTTVVITSHVNAQTSAPINIGSRLELFVDDYLVDRFEAEAALHLHKPRGKEVVLMNDQPWEDTTMGYFAVSKDGETYRMYYRGHHHGGGEQAGGEPICYAESKDGIHWVKPTLGLFAFKGSAENNIVLGGDGRKFIPTEKWRGNLGFGTGLGWRGDMVPFQDTNPTVTPDARYKALVRGARGAHQIPGKHSDYGMYPFKSPDGIHWTRMSDMPVITKGRFDSQNVAFWDAVRGRYVAFVRDLLKGSIRDVRMAVSDDFVNWTDPVPLKYPGDTDREMYTNAVIPYERAPHILIGFPTELTDLFSVEQVHPIFMTSRDGGGTFLRHGEPLIPAEAPQERDGNRSNYMAHGLVRGNEREYFVYATEGYGYEESDSKPGWSKKSSAPATRLRRFTYRVDGFMSVRCGLAGGAIVTKPLLFQGDRLVINYIAWPVHPGEVRVEMQDANGQPLEGLTLTDCKPLRGDEIDQHVTWRSGVTPGVYAGRPVRLRFQLKHADLFSFQFVEKR
jgi:hypothetical protein